MQTERVQKMKKVIITSLVFIPSLLTFVFLLGTSSCRFDPSGLPIAKDWYECDMELWNCPMVNKKLDLKLSGAPPFTQISNYKVIKNIKEQKDKPYQIYWDQPIFLWDIDMKKLIGSYLIMTGYDDWDVNNSNFLNIELLHDIDNFYVAYDSRAQPKPQWLTRDYKQEINPETQKPYNLIISMLDKTQSPPKDFVRLEIWRRDPKPMKDEVVNIQGNSSGKPGWGSIPADNRAMYVVIIKPQQEMNCNLGNQVKTLGHKDCYATVNDAEIAARSACLAQAGNLNCRYITCTTNISCSDKNTLIVGALKAYPHSSEIEFMVPSKASIKIKGKQYKSDAGGYLQFDYAPKTLDLQLNSMQLKFTPFNTDIGTFENNIVALLNNPKTVCKDPSPAFGQPCNLYQVAKGDFVAAESAKHKGKTLLWQSENIQPLDIQINHVKQTFNMTGTLQTTIKINGQDTNMDIATDLYGHFVNFSPKAVTIESTKFSECAENQNQDPVTLDSSGSFDIYVTSPGNLPQYEWYEDYGTSEQYTWGKKPVVTIGAYKLAYGVHSMTLKVADQDGVVDTDTFDVEVADTKPPSLTQPPDIQTSIQPPGTKSLYVDIGEASTSDACADKVMVSNDAPNGNIFPPGVTLVTWEADDGRGNITTAVQKVDVRVLAQFPIWIVSFLILIAIFGAGFVILKAKKKR